MSGSAPARSVWAAFRWGLLALPPAAAAVICGWLARDFLEVFGGGVAAGLFCGDATGGSSFDCATMAAHPSALLLGFPLAGWGLGFQLVLLALALGACLLRAPERRSFLAAGAALAAIGVLVALWLLRVMWVEIGASCGGCLAVHGLTTLSLLGFGGALFGARTSEPLRWRLLLPARHAFARDESAYFKSLIKLLGWLVLLASLALTWSRIHTPLAELRGWGTQQVAAFHARRASGAAVIDMTRFEGQPWRGAPQAPVSIVVVGDFECSQCRALARALDDLDQEWPGMLRTAFLNAPLSSRCNPAVPADLHPAACWLAAASECAAEQGLFDVFHDLLLRDLPAHGAEPRVIEERLVALGLEPAAFAACMEAGRGAAAVDADLALCRELGLTTTPSLVIEGHMKLGSVHPWMLRELLAPLVGEAGR